MLLVERHHIKGTSQILQLCTCSKILYNKCNYLMRKAWFSYMKLPNTSELIKQVKQEECYKNLHNTKTAKQTIRKCLTDWSNFIKALEAWKKTPNRFAKPKPPNYKRKLAQVIFYNETIKNGRNKKPKPSVITPSNNCFTVPFTKSYKQVVITPKNFGFIIDIQYEQKTKKKSKAKGYACIDIGLNNLCAITSDQTTPVLVNGRICKSINQQFNKHPTKRESRKRYFRLENYFHHVSKFIVKHCVKHKIGMIIIGKNLGWKQNINLGKVTNQNFCCIPFCKLIEKIKYKAELAGIEVIMTEEAYTSKASFFDSDPLPKYERGVKHQFSGIRVKRGLYKSSDGRIINSDCNGSGNIGRKVIENEKVLLRLDKSLAARPERVNPLRVFSV